MSHNEQYQVFVHTCMYVSLSVGICGYACFHIICYICSYLCNYMCTCYIYIIMCVCMSQNVYTVVVRNSKGHHTSQWRPNSS